MANEHWYGERRLNFNAPPAGATGLIINQWVLKDKVTGRAWERMFGFKPKTRFFIFRKVSGSYDYRSNGEDMCGGYQALMGYWHFATEEERDRRYDELVSSGYEIDYG